MTLREKLLSELRQQNDVNQKEIIELEEEADIERVKQQNAWISEMLSKYNYYKRANSKREPKG